jgi:hypothetical protein
MSTSPDNTQAITALLQAELSRLRDSSSEAWHSYLSWFTWFFTTQIAAIGLMITKATELLKPNDMILIAAVFMILNTLGTLAAVKQRAYCTSQRERAQRICEHLNVCAEQSGLSIETTSGFADHLVHSALGVFMVALTTGTAGCLYLVVRQFTK